MKPALRLSDSALFVLLVASPAAPLHAADARMSFFVTSAGPGKGGDLGGLAGADQHCQSLAAAVGAGQRSNRLGAGRCSDAIAAEISTRKSHGPRA